MSLMKRVRRTMMQWTTSPFLSTSLHLTMQSMAQATTCSLEPTSLSTAHLTVSSICILPTRLRCTTRAMRLLEQAFSRARPSTTRVMTIWTLLLGRPFTTKATTLERVPLQPRPSTVLETTRTAVRRIASTALATILVRLLWMKMAGTTAVMMTPRRSKTVSTTTLTNSWASVCLVVAALATFMLAQHKQTPHMTLGEKWPAAIRVKTPCTTFLMWMAWPTATVLEPVTTQILTTTALKRTHCTTSLMQMSSSRRSSSSSSQTMRGNMSHRMVEPSSEELSRGWSVPVQSLSVLSIGVCL
eukprot:m.204795 g.204795  ORF g.204795 m.204795 type:complete len:300 (-) comp10699_c0_seq2:363-1262(-)